ncbi:MAG: PRC-barrel domain-containing protein [Candidatus Krumholzibacteriia bacterium]
MSRRWQTVVATAAVLTLLAAVALAGPGLDAQKRTSATRAQWQSAEDSFQPQLHRVGKLVGAKVVNRHGEKLGEIEEIVLDPDRHTISYAVVEFARFLDLDDDLHAIPWGAFKVYTDHDGDPVPLLNVSEEQLARAQGFDDDDWPDVADARWTDRVFTAFRTTEDRDLGWRREHASWSYEMPVYDHVGDYQQEDPYRYGRTTRSESTWRGRDRDMPLYDQAGAIDARRDRSARRDWRRAEDEWSSLSPPAYDRAGRQTRQTAGRSWTGSERTDQRQRWEDREANLWYLEYGTEDTQFDWMDYQTDRMDPDRNEGRMDIDRMQQDRRSRLRSTAERSYPRERMDRRYAAGSDRQGQRYTRDIEKRKITELEDTDVINRGVKVGEVDEILVDTHAGALAYIIVEVDDDYAEDHLYDDDIELVAIPWHAVNLSNERIILNVDHSAMSSLAFRGDIDRLEDRQAAVDIHDRAACPTYWEVVYFVPMSDSGTNDDGSGFSGSSDRR